jgi:hypothetical protein
LKTRFVHLATAFAVAGSLAGGLEYGQASAAANQAPVVNGGAMTVRYEDVYSVHFTASDPEGGALTVVTPPVNDDWISCDGGPAADFTCDYSSSRYYDPAPLPTEPFQRTITYSVSDGSATTSGTWTITVLPPPVMEIIGHPTVTEGGEAVLQLKLSSNTYGSLIIPAHVIAVDTADGEVISTSTLMIDVGDGQTSVDIHIPIDDDAVDEPTEYFKVFVEAPDAIPYRFADGGNLVTVLDNDGATPSDRVPPVVGQHRNIVVERGGGRPAWVPFSPPEATDAIDGPLPATCNPAPMALMPTGRTTVTCTATDGAGNSSSGTFQVTVRNSKSNGAAIAMSGDRRCVVAGQRIWVEGEGFTPGATVTIQMQAGDLSVVRLQTVRADRKGRVRQIVKAPTAVSGDADVVLIGPAGNDDLVRMLPVRVGRSHRGRGASVMAMLRNRYCDST